jgi:hypothetical protein
MLRFLPCVSKIVAFIFRNIGTRILFAHLVGWLDSSLIYFFKIKAHEPENIGVYMHSYLLARFEGHNPWHTVYTGPYRGQSRAGRGLERQN